MLGDETDIIRCIIASGERSRTEMWYYTRMRNMNRLRIIDEGLLERIFVRRSLVETMKKRRDERIGEPREVSRGYRLGSDTKGKNVCENRCERDRFILKSAEKTRNKVRLVNWHIL